jgi:sterol 3beta-glucosyltransferase
MKISGHWFYDGLHGWEPSAELLRFLDAGNPLIYVGFGSLVDAQIKRATPAALDALKRLGLRAILLGGWGGLGSGDLPDNVFCLDSVPHSWLFPQVSAVVHHGGAGTTANVLRFVKPTVMMPFFADQPFWGGRVHTLGCEPRPIPFTRMNASSLTGAIDKVVNDVSFKYNAQNTGKKMQAEDGVGKAVGYIQAFLEKNSPFTGTVL